MDARLDRIFREEARLALGTERMTAERLIETVVDFVASAPPDEAVFFGQFLRGLAAVPAATPGLAPFEEAKRAVSEVAAAKEAFRQEKAAHVGPGSQTEEPAATVPPPAGAARPTPQRPPVRPFRVPYPAPTSRPRAAVPEPAPAPEPEPPADDIEDFTVPATAS